MKMWQMEHLVDGASCVSSTLQHVAKALMGPLQCGHCKYFRSSIRSILYEQNVRCSVFASVRLVLKPLSPFARARGVLSWSRVPTGIYRRLPKFEATLVVGFIMFFFMQDWQMTLQTEDIMNERLTLIIFVVGERIAVSSRSCRRLSFMPFRTVSLGLLLLWFLPATKA